MAFKTRRNRNSDVVRKKFREIKQKEIEDAEYKEQANKNRAKALPKITNSDWENYDFENPKNKKYIDKWLKSIVLPNKSPATYKQYRSGIRQFAMWNEKENDGRPFNKVRKLSFLEYQNYLLDHGLSKKTLEFKRNVVSSFCNFLETYISEVDERYETFRNFVKGTEAPKGKDKVYVKTPVTMDEFIKVKDELFSSKNYLLHAIWVTLFYTGNRISEVMQISVNDIKQEIPDGKKYVLTEEVRAKGEGKTGKLVKIKLNQHSLDALRLYKKKGRPKTTVWYEKDKDGNEIKQTKSKYLFFGKSYDPKGNSEHIASDTIGVYFRTIISPILFRRINPHLLRASFATYLLEQGGTIEMVKELLNHADISTSSKFYDLRSKDDLVDNELENMDFY